MKRLTEQVGILVLILVLHMLFLVGCGKETCRIEGCNDEVYRDGLCPEHYVAASIDENTEDSAETGIAVPEQPDKNEIEVGSSMFLGNNEWVVLEVSGNKAFLFSKYSVANMPYNRYGQSVTWETCSLRSWLNSDYILDNFSAEEQSIILKTEVDNEQFNYSNTFDRIYIPAETELMKYFDLFKELSMYDDGIEFWIRSGESIRAFECELEKVGCTYLDGTTPREDDIRVGLGGGNPYVEYPYAVRPVMWIDIQNIN